MSDPAGIKVSIDDREPVETPTSVVLPPGPHSIHPLKTELGGVTYLEQQKEWVTIAVGVKISVPIKPQAADLPVTLVRRTIELNGKTDSWAGIASLADLPNDSTFMGEKKFAMSRVYMCRDDKNLYWRVDFTETNPIRNPPNRTQGSNTMLA